MVASWVATGPENQTLREVISMADYANRVNGPNPERDERGRLLPGSTVGKNALGGGNPNVKRMAEYKKALMDCGSDDDIRELYGVLMSAAKGGDVQAAKLLLDHLCGRPSQTVELSGLDGGAIRTDVAAIVAIIREEEPDPERRAKIARRILQIGRQSEVNSDDGIGHGGDRS
jgi:hypothetical protein